jgi:murein DD-endopeptidase MepM/ murein hydrolase activator NlpD
VSLRRKVLSYGLLFVGVLLGLWAWGAGPNLGSSVAHANDAVSSYAVSTAPDAPQLIATGNSIDDLKQRRESIDQKREDIKEERQRVQRQENAAKGRLDGLQTTIQATSSRIQETEFQIKQAESELKALEAKLLEAEQAYENVRSAAVGRLQFMQRQQDSEGWAVLLQSKNLNEFLEKRYQLKRVYEADQAFLIDLKNKADEIVKQQQGVEAQKNAIALLRQQLLAQKDQYEAQAQQQTQLIARLKDNRVALQAAEAQLAQDSESVGNLIRERIAAAQRAAARRNGGGVVGTGRLIHPSGSRMTSGFGYRVHPILGTRRFHAGLDFGAPQGSQILAADSGTVIMAGWYRGYGNTVIIDHGGGLTTLYGHASRLYVSDGQSVKQGDLIAAVGSTGLSTGPHLHFETRENGNPVNPLKYL